MIVVVGLVLVLVVVVSDVHSGGGMCIFLQ